MGAALFTTPSFWVRFFKLFRSSSIPLASSALRFK